MKFIRKSDEILNKKKFKDFEKNMWQKQKKIIEDKRQEL